VVKVMDYKLIVGNLYKLGVYGIMQRCVIEHERPMILAEVQDGIVGGHYGGKVTTHTIFCAGLWWPTFHKDAKDFFQRCDIC